MQLILHQLLLGFQLILLAVYEHCVFLHLCHLGRLLLTSAPYPQLAYCVTQVKNVEFQSHVAEGELHNPIPAVDYSISCGKKWPPKYDGHLMSPLCHWLYIKNQKIYRIIEIIYLYQDILNYPLWYFHLSIC